MADRDAIEQLFSDYGWPMDSREWPVLGDTFTEDAEFTIVITGGDTIGPLQGRDAIVEFCSTTVNAQTDQRRHVITNIRLAPEKDTEAEVTAILTLIVVTDGALEVKSSGLYRTRAVLDGDRWRFARMHLTLDLAF
jgi:SnoaL-like domain